MKSIVVTKPRRNRRKLVEIVENIRQAYVFVENYLDKFVRFEGLKLNLSALHDLQRVDGVHYGEVTYSFTSLEQVHSQTSKYRLK